MKTETGDNHVQPALASTMGPKEPSCCFHNFLRSSPSNSAPWTGSANHGRTMLKDQFMAYRVVPIPPNLILFSGKPKEQFTNVLPMHVGGSPEETKGTSLVYVGYPVARSNPARPSDLSLRPVFFPLPLRWIRRNIVQPPSTRVALNYLEYLGHRNQQRTGRHLRDRSGSAWTGSGLLPDEHSNHKQKPGPERC